MEVTWKCERGMHTVCYCHSSASLKQLGLRGGRQTFYLTDMRRTDLFDLSESLENDCWLEFLQRL